MPGSLFAADSQQQGAALAEKGEKELAGGQYEEAALHGSECAAIFSDTKLVDKEIGCLTIVGRAKVYLGHYAEAATVLGRAASLARDHSLPESEAAALNDVGSAKYYIGDYSDAHASFVRAQAVVELQKGQAWYPRLRQITLANLAMLDQRLGKFERALDTYRDIQAGHGSMRPSERARLESNIGALYRRLGDPYKAIERYKAAERLFGEQKDHDGEIGVATNTGIVLAMDLGDLNGALDSFSKAERLADESGNRREKTEAALYASEVLRRMQRYPEAMAKAGLARGIAQDLKAPEEVWKAMLSLGKISETVNDDPAALTNYRAAIAIVETLRQGIAAASMRAAFLGDKTEAYDGAIRVLLRSPDVNASELFRYMEQGRARMLRERLQMGIVTLADVQKRLSDQTAVVEYWNSRDGAAALWITRDSARVLRMDAVRDSAVEGLVTLIKSGADGWRTAASELGRVLVAPLPLAGIRRLIVVPDRRLQVVPFEALPVGDHLLIDEVEVGYLPAASMVSSNSRPRGWLAPWSQMLVAFAFRSTPAGAGLFGEALSPLPNAADEIRQVASQLGGRAALHSGSDNLKRYATAPSAVVPVLHFATHGIADPDDPDRSRLAFSGAVEDQPVEYLFAREIFDLKLTGVRLATLAACDTETGKTVGGEGVAALSRAFLGAGAAATVSTLWRISDRSSEELMRRFYANLAGGQTAGSALRSAKLSLRRSGSSLAQPRHWAAYVLNGNADVQTPRPTRGLLAGTAALAVAFSALALLIRRRRAKKESVQTASANR